MKTNKIRTRYAPSPTGFFHIGGARTALFNYLFAKHHNGTFVCRIEDTDVERNVDGGIASQLDSLDWLKITPDESPRHPGAFAPYVQTQKLQRYQELAHQLLKEQKAYYCFCTKEQLQKQRETAMQCGVTPKYNRRCLQLSDQEIQDNLKNKIPAVIRLKMPDNVEIKWQDLIRGELVVPTSALTDPVILKSNGIPMYNFAVVVDDYDMQITHILRGEEHISNTPYQIAIKEALGFHQQAVQYGHLSIIVDETGKKLSKRNSTLKQFVEDYKKMGFLPEAIINFLSLLGWSSKSNTEIMSQEQIVESFDIDRISKAPAYFDFQKLLWIGNQYMKKMEDKTYLSFIKPFLKLDSSSFISTEAFEMGQLIFKPQLSYAAQINELLTHTFLTTDFKNIPLALKDLVYSDNFQKCLRVFKQVLETYSEMTIFHAQEIVDRVKQQTQFRGKDLYLPIRFAAIGKEHGPEMHKILFIVGKTQILRNLDLLIKS